MSARLTSHPGPTMRAKRQKARTARRRRQHQAADRELLEAAIEAAIDALNALDGGDDFEPDDEIAGTSGEWLAAQGPGDAADTEENGDWEADEADREPETADYEPTFCQPVSGFYMASAVTHDGPLRPPAPLPEAPAGFVANRVLR